MTKWWMLAGVAVSILIVFSQKQVIWTLLKKEKKNIWSCLREVAKRFILAVLSPDYSCQKCLKTKLKKQYGADDADAYKVKPNEHREILTKCIRWSNVSNCVISFFVCVGVILTAQLCGDNGWFWAMLGFIAYRTLSRTMEINISFVKDITEKDKKSTLEMPERTGLVVTSLIEEVFLFAGLYAFGLPGAQNIWVALTGGLHSMTIDAFSVVAESLTWSVELFEFVATYQKACTVLLFSLVIVSYLSDAGKNIAEDHNNVVCANNAVENECYADNADEQRSNTEDNGYAENDSNNGLDTKHGGGHTNDDIEENCTSDNASAERSDGNGADIEENSEPMNAEKNFEIEGDGTEKDDSVNDDTSDDGGDE